MRIIEEENEHKRKVSIRVSRGRLQLYYRYGTIEGTRKRQQRFLSLGLSDSLDGRKQAEVIADQLEHAIAHDLHDEWLEKFKNREGTVEQRVKVLTMPELWGKYVAFKSAFVRNNTIYKDYTLYERALNECPFKEINQAVQIRDWLLANRKASAVKRYLTNYAACCKWAISSELITENPFRDLIETVKQPKQSKSEIDPFTKEERDKIIQAFRDNKYYSHYANLIEFLFLTGCRTGEALALQFKHLQPKAILFEQNIEACNTHGGKEITKGLKTQPERTFPVNTQLGRLLERIKERDYVEEDLVFPAPNGGLISIDNLRRRGWHTILKETKIKKRKLYQTRHTFITLALEKGVKPKDVADIVGNSVETIFRHYLGKSKDIVVPEI